MKPPMNKIYNVNWIDGMKINKSHFVHNDQVRQYESQNFMKAIMKTYEYGLLPYNGSSVKMPINQEEHKIFITTCKAITRNGIIIDIDEEDKVAFDLSTLTQDQQNSVGRLLLVVSADPYKRVALGEPFSEELPPRLPFSRPTYNLNIIKEEQYDNPQYATLFVPIGRIKKENNVWELDETYLPPSTQIVSHPKLYERFKKFEKILDSIWLNATEVTQNAQSKKRRGEINDLAENTFYLLEKVVFYLANNMSHFRNISPEESPIQTICTLNGLGKVVLAGLNCLKKVDKEALLRYYESHLGMKAHEFEGDMDQLSKIEYNHIKLNEVLDQTEGCLISFKHFVSKAVNLEFHSVERVDVLQENTVKRTKLDIF